MGVRYALIDGAAYKRTLKFLTMEILTSKNRLHNARYNSQEFLKKVCILFSVIFLSEKQCWKWASVGIFYGFSIDLG